MKIHVDKLSWIDVKNSLPKVNDDEVLVLIYDRISKDYFVKTAVRFKDMWEIVFHDDTFEIYDNDKSNDEKVIAWAKYPTVSDR